MVLARKIQSAGARMSPWGQVFSERSIFPACRTGVPWGAHVWLCFLMFLWRLKANVSCLSGSRLVLL